MPHRRGSFREDPDELVKRFDSQAKKVPSCAAVKERDPNPEGRETLNQKLFERAWRRDAR